MVNLKTLREERRISQQILAEKIGTNQQIIHRYEHGFYEPDIQTLKLLANFFDTSIDYLVGNTDIRHKIEAVEKFDLNEDEAALVENCRKLNSEIPRSKLRGIGSILPGRLRKWYCFSRVYKKPALIRPASH